jgi:hypothetical protein
MEKEADDLNNSTGNAAGKQENIRKLHIQTDGAVPLSPYLFGHNLEHTRSCVALIRAKGKK